MDKNFFGAIATLVGTIIGAGVLGIPYVVAKSGFLVGLVHLLILGFAIVFGNLYIAEVSLRTKKTHQLAGYAEKYLGKKGKLLMFLATLISVYGAMIAYLIGEGASLNALFNINPTIAILGFFLIMAVLIYKGLNVIKGWELTLGCIMLFILLLIVGFSFPQMNLQNLLHLDLRYALLPYGVILFAFLGALAVPEMKELLTKNKKQLKKAVIIGSLIPLIFYVLFVLVTVAVTGLRTNQIATIGLGKVVGTHMLILGNLFAILSMATSFLALALGLKWTYQYDYKLNKHLAWALTMFVPLVLVLLKVTNFIQAIGISGAIAGGLEGTLIVFMFHRARKNSERKPEFKVKTNLVISCLLVAIFIGGIIYTILQLLS
ncbi:MAG: aromatic amino acid transport family protein [Nanoarchaeota archaeon]|nr:aromatic amino acid transport family protein [Nanoarchaeota archaeon]